MLVQPAITWTLVGLSPWEIVSPPGIWRIAQPRQTRNGSEASRSVQAGPIGVISGGNFLPQMNTPHRVFASVKQGISGMAPFRSRIRFPLTRVISVS